MTKIEPIKTRLRDDTKLKEVRIIPKGIGYMCEIVYEKEVQPLNLNPDNIVGIDLGLRNIVTIVNNIGKKPIVIKGGFVKSINQYYNKIKAEIQSIYDKQGIKFGYKMLVLNYKRNNKIKDAMHKISRFIINYCIEHNIGTIVIGHNDNWKQKANMGKRNNQNFVSIPFYTLIHDITYKAEEVGIKVIEQEESYTSNLINQCHLFFLYYSLIYQKCSFLDDESIEHHDKYLGKRIKRGIFRSAKGILINAVTYFDYNLRYISKICYVQGALNIIKKAFPKAFSREIVDRIEGLTHSEYNLRYISECVKGYTHCDIYLVLSHKHNLNNLFGFDSLAYPKS